LPRAVGDRRGARVVRDDLPLGDPGPNPRREPRRRRLGDRDCRPRSGLRTAGGRQRGTPPPRRRARDHLGLAPRRLPPPRPRARQGGGRPLPGPACEMGLAGRPKLPSLLPAPGAVRRLLLAAVPADLPRSSPRARPPRVDGGRGVGDRQCRCDHRRPPAGPVAVQPRESRPHGADRALVLVEAPQLLLRVGHVVRRRARRDRGAVGVGVVDRPGRPPLPALPRDRDPRHRGAGASQPCGLRRLPAHDERVRAASAPSRRRAGRQSRPKGHVVSEAAIGAAGTKLLRIGELSRRVGVPVESLRAWERRYGLLTPGRTQGGFRLYGEDDVARVLAMRANLERGLFAAEAARLALAEDAAEPIRAPTPVADTAELAAALERFDEAGAQQALDRLLATLTIDVVLRDV